MFGRKQKEIDRLRVRVAELESRLEAQAAEQRILKAALLLVEPKKAMEAVQAVQYKEWMNTDWCGEPAAEDMKPTNYQYA